MSTEIATREDTGLVDGDLFQPVTIFDEERYAQVARVADIMARATTLPEHLKGKSNNRQDQIEEARGNCFMVCNLAANWGFDPWAVAQACSFVYGKFVLEGKLVRAVIRRKLGFDFHYRYFGERGKMDRRVYVSDKLMVDKDGELLSEDQLLAIMENPLKGFRITTGTLQKWHTKKKDGGVNDNWRMDEDKMFRERGAREWCREYRPDLMLGVYTPDEFDEVEHTIRSERARDITHNPLIENGGQAPMERVNASTGEIIESEVKREATAKQTSPARNGDEPSASAKPASTDAGRGGDSSDQDSRPTNSDSSSSATLPDDGEQADRRDTPQRLSADTLRKYASWLARQDNVEKIEKANREFVKEIGGYPPKGSADFQLMESIYVRQKKRAAGEIDADGLLEEINAEIDKSYGLDDTFPGDL